MKTLTHLITRLISATLLTLGALASSCNKLPSGNGGQGSLVWSFSPEVVTRASDIPDTDAFRLRVVNSAGEVLYDGAYGNSPEAMLVNPGSYTITAVSRDFRKPEFDAPQFGDEQVVVVKSGAVTRVLLDCSQLNCGLRLRIEPDFAETYPGGSLEVTSGGESLIYGPSETRTGFFKPGTLSVALREKNKFTPLITRRLEAREILTIGISCPSGSGQTSVNGGELSIKIDTLRIRQEEDYVIGDDDTAGAGTEKSKAYGVSQVKDHAGEKGVWVCGYIVGGDLSSGKNGIKFEAPFDSYTNIAIAPRSSVSEKASCVSVQLTKGAIRDALNLVDNPSSLGKKVYLRGDIEAAYYGIPGIKNLTEYSFD
ncbi:MAG: DUF4493 domain-containing protein [Bacteroidales bacterium]|nr:DUF4493 domain-containing protein [Bacteroidales bacterium]